MLALKTNVHIWKEPILEQLDILLSNNNFTLIDLNWENYELLEDKQHFTLNGYKKFCTDLVNKISDLNFNNNNIFIYADSTIDYLNWDSNIYNNFANNYLINLLKKKNFNAEIDAISGSGFINLNNINKHFRARYINNYKHDKKSIILIIGGWNDNKYNLNRLSNSIKSFKNLLT